VGRQKSNLFASLNEPSQATSSLSPTKQAAGSEIEGPHLNRMDGSPRRMAQ